MVPFRSSNPHILKSSNFKFRLVVFDLDGTLVDSLRDLAESANALLVERGGRPLPDDAIGRMVGEGAATLVARVFEAAAIPTPPDALERFLKIYDDRLLTFTRPYPGIPEVMSQLVSRVPLAILTNKPIDATRRILNGLDLAKYFQSSRIIGGDGPLPRKPDPAGLRRLAADAGVVIADTLLVGDSLIDLKTARAASAPLCLARYGFGVERFPLEELGNDDAVIDQPLELLSLV